MRRRGRPRRSSRGEEFRRRDGGQSDGARADHDDGVAGLDTAVEDADLVGGGEDVGEQDGVVALHGLGQTVHGQVREGNTDVFGLGAVDQVAQDPAATAQALAARLPPAVVAASAGGDARDEDPVAAVHGAHVGAGLDDFADRLVAQHGSGAYLGDVAFEDVQVGAADGGRVDTHDDVGGLLDARVGDLVPGRLAGAVEHECLHGERSSSVRRLVSVPTVRRAGGGAQGPVGPPSPLLVPVARTQPRTLA